VERYRSRISGPLLDRIDLHVEVPAPSLRQLKERPREGSREVAARVAEAKRRQLDRLGDGLPLPVNAAMTPADLERWCPLGSAGQRLLDSAYQRLGLSARALGRVRKLARTIADLAGEERIRAAHVGEAIQYRTLDRRTG
jgi:magnesium chelatase family protein